MKKNIFKIYGIYSDGMVLQQKLVNCANGVAEPEAEVSLSFRGKKYSCIANQTGDWKIEFDPGKAGGPFDLHFFCNDDSIIFNDVYVGEVWLSSGQSNAQLPMERLKYSYSDEFKLRKNEKIRMITIPISYSFDGPKKTVENPKWICASPENLGAMSGTAYFFAKKLNKELKVPVGIINASQGGSPITSWMDSKSLLELNKTEYLERASKWNNLNLIEETKKKVADLHSKWDEWIYKNDKGIINKWEQLDYSEIVNTWSSCSIPGDFCQIENAGVMWFKKEIDLSQEQINIFNKFGASIWMGTIVDSDKIWINGVYCGETPYCYPPRRYSVPDNTLKCGKNTISIRVQKNSRVPVRFYKEKPYSLFSNNCYVHPVAVRNLERVEEKKYKNNSKGVLIDLEGEWKYSVSCECECRPGEMFFEWEPTALYNSMLAPCFNCAIKGAIWYQGESNALLHGEYKDLLCKLIDLWREKFVYAQNKMPFVVLQLPNWNDGRKNEIPDIGCWPQLRKAQADAVYEKENAGLAVLIDAGEWNDLHPEKKQTAGYRAGIEALRIAYGKKYSKSPEVLFCEKKDKVFTLRFNCENSNIVAYDVVNNSVDFSKESDTVFGFSFMVKTKDKQIVLDAQAKVISKNEVEVYEPKLPADCSNTKFNELRYLWNDNPEIVNLYTSEKLPVAPILIQL